MIIITVEIYTECDNSVNMTIGEGGISFYFILLNAAAAAPPANFLF